MVGVTSHNLEVCAKFMDFDEIDFFMISCNPSFDYTVEDNVLKLSEDRLNFYKECEKNKIGLSVMKAFGGGRLLNKHLSPLNYKLTVNQCIQYCLDKPSVLTVLPGVKSLDELKTSLSYLNAPDKKCDYSFIGELSDNSSGVCMYCGHCQPCPNDIPIALISKLYDLSMIGDDLAKIHYSKLEHKANECSHCYKCEDYCMFNVKIVDKIDKIVKFYGE